MKSIAFVFLFCLLPATGAAAGFGLPWFHPRPRPVLFDQSPAASNPSPPHRPVVKRRDVSYQHAAGESNEPGRNVRPPENRSAASRSTPATRQQ